MVIDDQAISKGTNYPLLLSNFSNTTQYYIVQQVIATLVLPYNCYSYHPLSLIKHLKVINLHTKYFNMVSCQLCMESYVTK